MKTIKQYLISSIVIILGFVAVTLIYLFLIKPLVPEISDTKTKIANSNSELNQKKEKLKKLEEIKDKLEEYRKVEEKIKSVLPSEKDLPKLFHMMEVIAAESNIGLGSISSGASGASAETQSTPAATTSSSIQKISLSLDVSGTYDQIIGYLNNIGNFVQITNVNSSTLSPKEGDIVNVQISAYSLYLPISPQ